MHRPPPSSRPSLLRCCVAAALFAAAVGAWAQPGSSPPATGHASAARLDPPPVGVAPVDVRDAWARPAVAGQSGAGIYARLLASAGARLVGASTPVASTAEVHEMRMDGDVMRMRAVTGGLDLPPGQPVVLGPGGYHLMLTGLKQPLVRGTSFPLTLRFVDRSGQPSMLEVKVDVRGVPTAAPMGHAH